MLAAWWALPPLVQANGPAAQALQPEPHPPVLNVPHERREIIERLTGETLRVHTKHKCPASMADHDGAGEQHAAAMDKCPMDKCPIDYHRNASYYVHVHKCGGTTVCHLANKNGEKISAFARRHNCNNKGDGPNAETHRWEPGFSLRCDQRRQFQSSFHMIERWVDWDWQLCGMTRAIMVRDPLDRIISNYLFETSRNGRFAARLTVEQLMKAIQPGATYGLRKPLALQGDTMVGFSTAAWDNLLTRTLGGPDVFRLPARALNQTHLTKAKDRLRGFEVIMMLDEFDMDSAQLAHVMGWSTLLIDHANEGADHMPSPFSEEQLRTLAEVNAMDFELVCLARELARERTRRAQAHGAPTAGHELRLHEPDWWAMHATP